MPDPIAELLRDRDENDPATTEILRMLLQRIGGACLIETDASGVFTGFGPGAEAFFGCPAREALGRLHYSAFHDPAELEACRGAPEFKAALEDPGYSEEVWRVIPRAGAPFRARVTLVPLKDPAPRPEGDMDSAPRSRENAPRGWIALYRKLPAGDGKP